MNHVNGLACMSLVTIVAGLMLYILPLISRAGTPVAEVLQEARSHYADLLEARADYQAAGLSGRLSQAEDADFRALITQLKDRVLDDCAELAGQGATTLPVNPPCRELLSGSAVPASLDLSSELTEQERTDLMIGQLNNSFGDFDESLLREQERVKAKTPRSSTSTNNASSGGGSGDGSSDDEGAEVKDSDDQQDASQEEDNEGDQQQPGQEQAGDETAQENQASSERSGTPGKNLPHADAETPEDIPNGSDDDIVARQLREAAEQERDPVLREKLWEEYRRYKAGAR